MSGGYDRGSVQFMTLLLRLPSVPTKRHRNIYIPTNVTSLNRNLGKEGTIVFHYFEHDALNVCFCLQIDVMFPI